MQVISKKSVILLFGMFSFVGCQRPIVSVLPQLPITTAKTQTSSDQAITLTSGPIGEGIASYDLITSRQDTVEALARNDNRINRLNPVQHRFRHTQSWSVASAAGSFNGPSLANATHKMTGMQRFLLKKLTNRFRHQQASTKPAKPVLVEGILILGAVLLLGGIVLVLLTSGTGFALGVIALAAGLVCLLIGLF